MALDVTMIQNEQPHIIPEEPRNYKRRRLALQIAKNDDAWMLVAGTQSMEELTKRAIEEITWFSQDKDLSVRSSQHLNPVDSY